MTHEPNTVHTEESPSESVTAVLFISILIDGRRYRRSGEDSRT